MFGAVVLLIDFCQVIVGVVTADLVRKSLPQIDLSLVVFAHLITGYARIEVRTGIARLLRENCSPQRSGFGIATSGKQSLALFKRVFRVRSRCRRGLCRFRLRSLRRLGSSLRSFSLGGFRLCCFGLRCSCSRSGLRALDLCSFGIGISLLAHGLVSLSSAFVRFAQVRVVLIRQAEIRQSTLVILHLHADLTGQHVSFGILLVFGQHGTVFTEGLFVLTLGLKTGTLFNTGVNSPRLRHSQQKS